MSASAPAGRANTAIGRVVATSTSETISGSGRRLVINQPLAICWIQVPRLETMLAVHNARNSGTFNGSHGLGWAEALCAAASVMELMLAAKPGYDCENSLLTGFEAPNMLTSTA